MCESYMIVESLHCERDNAYIQSMKWLCTILAITLKAIHSISKSPISMHEKIHRRQKHGVVKDISQNVK